MSSVSLYLITATLTLLCVTTKDGIVNEEFWEGVAVGLLIASLFGVVVYMVALIDCCLA